MNTQFHTPSFGDEIFDIGDVGGTGTSTPNSSMLSNNNNNSYMYQQHSAQSANQTKRMISLHNTSDEYHTANEESFTTNANSMNTTTNNGQQQQQQGGVVTTPTTTMAARKQMIPVMESEPSKPLSAYALFFRDTVSAIKQQNPTCSFQELSKIVASMWDALDPVHKGVYNQKNELAKIEYLKQMKIYRQQLEQQQQQLQQQQQQQQEHIQNSNIIMTNTDTINSTPQQSQQNSPQVVTTNNQQQQQFQQSPAPVSNITTNASTPNAASSAPSAEQTQSLTEGEAVQKCTRENCTKRAIINPDWEDEYCSNECVIIHCRNVFNAWVQSNLEAKQQPQQQQQQQQQQSTTT